MRTPFASIMSPARVPSRTGPSTASSTTLAGSTMKASMVRASAASPMIRRTRSVAKPT